MSKSAAGVLLLGSELSTRRSLCGLFEAAGYRPMPVVNGLGLISRMRVDHPALVVIDADHAFCEPLGLTRSLWSGALFASTPVLVLSSDRNSERVLGWLKAGAADVFTKPIVPGVLLARVREILEDSRAPGAGVPLRLRQDGLEGTP